MSVFERRAQEGILVEEHPAEDTLFINQRFDGETLRGGASASRYVHCTFANVSFKGATLTGLTFEDCVFVGCYFRQTTLTSCRFPASRFIDCDFVKPSIFDCSFAYARFTGSPVEHDYIAAAIRGDHNIRRDIAKNLAQEAQAHGRTKDARQFRLDAIAANEAFLRAGFRGETDYYRRKFQGFNQVWAWLAYWWSRANGLVWGYGERAGRLARNLVLLGGLLFPVLLLLSRDDLRTAGGEEAGVADCWYLSFANLLNNTSLSGITIHGGWARLVSTVEAAIGIIALGLFITLLFRAATRR
jgi:uncharacterized protein YjbI with pentapeptide repeats